MHWGYEPSSFDSFTVDSPQGKPAEQKNTSVKNKPVVGRAVMHFPFIIVLGIKYYNIHLGPKYCVGAETGTWALMKWSRAWQLRIGFFSYSSHGKLSFLLFFHRVSESKAQLVDCLTWFSSMSVEMGLSWCIMRTLSKSQLWCGTFLLIKSVYRKVRKIVLNLFTSYCWKKPVSLEREHCEQLNFPHFPPTPSKIFGLLISSSA